MMPDFDVLKTVAAASQGRTEGALPPRIVRFTLEYAVPPDLGTERQRIAAFLQAGNFELQPLDQDLPQFVVLQFPGVQRTISTPTLYAMANELARGLNLVTCAPDVGATFVVDPDPDNPITESAVGDGILKLTCWAEENDTLPKRWAIESIRADKAWQKTRGAGILVAQPDTGVAPHPEIEAGALDLKKGKNILNNSDDPTDPLIAGTGNPGHGTGTCSVVISRVAGTIVGSAPEATLVPIRCIESVIVGIDGTPIARAVAHAKRIGADVITMSLGGPFYSPALGAAVAQAVEDGIIVCAAAGNCIQPFVVYPASDPNVIAVAGVDRNDLPWKGTSRGPKVDVAAPSENVFVARRQPGDGGVGTIEPSQGTSFATALTAGVAALWLAHFGRDAVRAEAKKRGITVHELFRAAVRASARAPHSWDNTSFGAGIVDAEALLNLKLADIPAAPALPEGIASDHPEGAINAVMIAAAGRTTEGAFDWRRHGVEAVYLATDAWRRGSPSYSMLVESARKPRPSAEVAATAPAVLRTALAQAADAPAMSPPVVSVPRQREVIRSLGGKGLSGPESSATISVERARSNLQNGGIAELQRLAEETFAKLDEEGGDVGAIALRRGVLESTERVVRNFVDAGERALDVGDRVALEALIKLKDRPALRVVDGTVDPNDPLFGEWGGALITTPELPQLTAAVGRIDGDGEHIGSGFLIADGVVMTNRHVLEALADEVVGPASRTWVFSVGQITIDFSPTANGTARFRIRSVIAAGLDAIRETVRLPRLDMALLEVETINDAGTKLPAPLTLIDARPELDQKGDLFTIGYPARPSTSSMIDPATGKFSLQVSQRLAQIFNLSYGRKYLSPGRVEQPTGVPGDIRHWVFTHDATTLGGNSGSCVIRFFDRLGVAGLHFGGATLTANYAHSLAAVKASGVLPNLMTAGISWW
jgi:hypothetical protein